MNEQTLQQEVEKAKKAIYDRSFAGRHPELGKMINCPVCQERHRSSKKCQQRFVEAYIEEDLETGEKTTIYREAPKTKKGIVGGKHFEKKRHNPHPSKTKLQFIESVKRHFGDQDADPKSEGYQKALDLARQKARKELHQLKKGRSKRIRREQKRSRRINRGS